MSEEPIPPDPHHGPYSQLSDVDLMTAHKRVAADPDDPTAAFLLAEMVHRGLAKG